MFFSGTFDNTLWWIFPLVMIVFCLFMMRGRMGSMCGFGSHGADKNHIDLSDSATDILDKRYARGEINKDEYETRKLDIRKG